eukprot:TRINITY_DN9910_c0_g1_i1.p1 TRINITY_DN9910_c0_g1~~TRINITY_DN9910_c0_g1_i1.p1  ORF type:complete len:276 (-),score=117.79 TRINITY_DN9910_c0_g1_i1:38-865(-)
MVWTVLYTVRSCPEPPGPFYSTMEEVDQLVEGLNSRGIREGELKEKLLAERERIENRVKKIKVDQLVVDEKEVEELRKGQLQQVQDRRDKASKNTGTESVPMGTHLQEVVEISLRDQILELEEKIWVGTLGNLHVKNRDKWTHAIGDKKYLMGADSLVWGDEDNDRVEKDALLGEETRPGTPEKEGNKRDSGASTNSNSEMRGLVKQMAAAILQVGQMISDREKFLKEPLGENEKERKKRLKREEDEKKGRTGSEAEEEEEEKRKTMEVEGQNED